MRRATRGYTLIEILGAFFIMTVMLTLVTGIFVENGRQRAAALGMLDESLSAAAALDQVAQDLEGALFIAADPGSRPDEHPWRFASEGISDHGAKALRFVSQNAPLANRAQQASGWVEIAYFLEEDRHGQSVLYRWISARPPTQASSRFPSADDEGSMRLAADVSDFGLRFLNPTEGWVDEWDSAFEAPDAAMPQAVEISLGLMRDARIDESVEDEDAASRRVAGLLHSRRVVLLMRPIDPNALLELALEDGDDDGAAQCFTVAQCVAEGDAAWYQTEIESDCSGDETLCKLLSDSNATCWDEIVNAYGAVAEKAPETCVQ